MQGGSLLFLIIQLNREGERAVQRIEAGLRLAAIDGKAPHRQSCGDVVGIRGQNLLVIFGGFGKISGFS